MGAANMTQKEGPNRKEITPQNKDRLCSFQLLNFQEPLSVNTDHF